MISKLQTHFPQFSTWIGDPPFKFRHVSNAAMPGVSLDQTFSQFPKAGASKKRMCVILPQDGGHPNDSYSFMCLSLEKRHQLCWSKQHVMWFLFGTPKFHWSCPHWGIDRNHSKAMIPSQLWIAVHWYCIRMTWRMPIWSNGSHPKHITIGPISHLIIINSSHGYTIWNHRWSSTKPQEKSLSYYYNSTFANQLSMVVAPIRTVHNLIQNPL